MKLIVGLGNPGKEYEQTRHNIGFIMLDALAERWNINFQSKSKFTADIAEKITEGERVWLVKSAAFYNISGEAVRKIRDYYKLTNSDILVIHDDMALPFGTIRTRLGGSSAGNNGIQSLNEHLGEDYVRIRVGIWSGQREKTDAVDFVLGNFNSSERKLLKTKGSEFILHAVSAFIQSGHIDHETSRLEE